MIGTRLASCVAIIIATFGFLLIPRVQFVSDKSHRIDRLQQEDNSLSSNDATQRDTDKTRQKRFSATQNQHLQQQQQQQRHLQTSSFTTNQSFRGPRFIDNIALSGTLFIPPDPIGAVSRTTLVAVVNGLIEIRTKSGSFRDQSNFESFFFSLSPTSQVFDPKVVYDEYENRFVIVVMEASDSGGAGVEADRRHSRRRQQEQDSGNATAVSRILLAVSSSDSPSFLSPDYWSYQAIDALEFYIDPHDVNATGEYLWADYPGLEVSPEAVYITANMNSFKNYSVTLTNRLWIVAKNDFYNFGPISYTRQDPYNGTVSDLTTMPAYVHGGPIGNKIGTFLVAYDGCHNARGINCIIVTTVLDPLGTPSFVRRNVSFGKVDNYVGFVKLPSAPQLGSTAKIDVGIRRTLDAEWRGDQLWLTTTLVPRNGPNANQTTAYWIRINTKTFRVEDQGEIGGEDIAPNTFTFFASVAVNPQGVAAFGFAASGPLIYPGAYAVGRQSSDTPATVSTSVVVRQGEDSYLRSLGGDKNRWGDYSGIGVDPADGSFWVFNEYAAKRGNVDEFGEDGIWNTAWIHLVLSPPSSQPTRKPTPTPTFQPTSKPPSPSVPIDIPQGSCFSERNLVEVEARGLVAMKDLQIGDKVKDASGNMVSIYSFGHFHSSTRATYLQVYVRGLDHPLEVSNDHMVFVNGTAVPASTILVGDMITVVAPPLDNAMKVEKIKTVVRSGAYAPFTTSGTILVSGIPASSYVTLQRNMSVLVIGQFQTTLSMHWLAHVSQTPHRLLCKTMGMEFCQNTETYNQDGLSRWVEGPFYLASWLVQQNGLIMAVIFFVTFTLSLILYATEISWVYFVAILGAFYVWNRRKR